jgi:F-type H+-transporting ATPase subunit b
MEILAQTTNLIASNGSFGINTNILETGLVNNLILCVGLFIFLGGALTTALEQRQTEIITGVEDSEKRLNEATNRLAEAEKQLSQANVIIEEIKKETQITKGTLLTNDYNQAKNELSRRFNTAITTLKNRERLILSEIKQNISLLALKQVISTIEKQTNLGEEQITYMQKSIQLLGTTGD